MCGIAGFTGSPSPERIQAALDSIRHRGPDQHGYHASNFATVGAVRLKIIDLGGGDQPMKTDDDNHIIAFNGEVYNHAEVRRELESLGVRFQSHCDTEVVLKAYVQWGKASIAKLRGMFAYAIWTESERKLLLVRDRMGIKPLYFYRRNEDLYFGSELKTLFVHPVVERRFDLTGLNLYLSLNYIPGTHTAVSGVEKLKPGHWLEWHNGQVTSEAYWKLNWNPGHASVGEAKEELDALLRSSIAEHLVADVPLGVWSSGGLDSSAVVHYASEQVRNLKTFSVSFKGRSFDESAWFREIAGKYGTDHHEFDLNPEVEMRDAIEQMAYYSDEPSSDAGAVPVWFLSKMTRNQVTVALSGEGADELFGGYNTYLADDYAQPSFAGPRLSFRRLGLAAAGLLPVTDDKIGLDYKVKRMLEGSLLPARPGPLLLERHVQ